MTDDEYNREWYKRVEKLWPSGYYRVSLFLGGDPDTYLETFTADSLCGLENLVNDALYGPESEG